MRLRLEALLLLLTASLQRHKGKGKARLQPTFSRVDTGKSWLSGTTEGKSPLCWGGAAGAGWAVGCFGGIAAAAGDAG